MPNIFKYNNEADYISEATKAIEKFIMEQGKSPLRVALSGGSSPKVVYEKLAESKRIDWSDVELYQVDERFVSSDSNESNAKLIHSSLTSKTPNLKLFHTFNTSKKIEEALSDYEKELGQLKAPLFDLVLLGLGNDGHTASLFPYGPELKENERLVTESNSPQGVTKRVGLSFPAIMSSKKIIFLIRGKEKGEIIRKWLGEGARPEEIPAKIILQHPDIDVFYDQSV